ncbi:MAG: hypothetical protein M1608_05825, partial [Candidatus Omnitrophica bacterium]|nr:hypothetical protein [Candidatus Omnitrophota bacterium]
MLLLKGDGTLWQCGTTTNSSQKWLALRSVEPHRLGTEADWAEILSGGYRIYAWKRDGRAWMIYWQGVNPFQKPKPYAKIIGPLYR